jgi:hypothetical protein
MTRDVTERGLRAGDVGTVVERHIISGVAEEGYSVELRRGHWLGTLGVAILAYIAASVLESVGTSRVLELLHSDPRLATVLSVIVGLATMVLGGYVAASIRQGAAQVLAGIIFVVVALLFVTMPSSAPLWYGLTFLIAGPVAALSGGRLKLIRRAHRGA